jgi:cupin fold WbuC family metalloprotein
MNFLTQNKINSEVYHSKENFFSMSKEDINKLINLAKKTPRNRVRFCSHSSDQDTLHEMFIVHPKGAYVRPHKHINKIESMLVIDGEVDYIMFDNDGNVDEIVEMGGVESKKSFYQTIRQDKFHTLIIKSEWLVFLEITNGPFDKKNTIFPNWSPLDSEGRKINQFMSKIIGMTDSYNITTK